MTFFLNTVIVNSNLDNVYSTIKKRGITNIDFSLISTKNGSARNPRWRALNKFFLLLYFFHGTWWFLVIHFIMSSLSISKYKECTLRNTRYFTNNLPYNTICNTPCLFMYMTKIIDKATLFQYTLKNILTPSCVNISIKKTQGQGDTFYKDKCIKCKEELLSYRAYVADWRTWTQAQWQAKCTFLYIKEEGSRRVCQHTETN